jgi:copper chaperone
MQAFRVDDMTCGHCVSTITKAIRGADRDAKVTIDLARHLVMVEPNEADTDELRDAIAEAGYTPVPVEATTVVAKDVKAGRCCGCHG